MLKRFFRLAKCRQTTRSTSAAKAVIAILLTLLTLTKAEGAKPQERLFDLLPYQEGIYLWSDDFASLLQQLKRLQPTNEAQWLSALDLGERPTGSSDSVAKRFHDHRKAQATSLAEMWNQAEEEKIFDGEACLMFVVDKENDLVPMFVARSSADESTLEKFSASLPRLRSPQMAFFEETYRDIRSANDEANELPSKNWRYENGWFCVCGNRDILEETFAYLTKDVAAEKRLGNDRSFQRAMALVDKDQDEAAAISMFISAEAIPLVRTSLKGTTRWARGMDEDEWKGFYLDSLRGVGAQLRIFGSSSDETENVSLGLDAFALITQPRRGVLRGLGDQGNPIRVNALSIPYAPIRSLLYLRLDGDELHEGVMEGMIRLALADDGGSVEEAREKVASQSENAMLRLLKGACDIYPYDEGNGASIGSKSIGLEVTDMERFGEIEFGGLWGDFEQKKLREFGEPYNLVKRDDAIGWGPTEEDIRENNERLQKQLDEYKRELEQLEAEGIDSEEEVDRKAGLERLIGSYQQSIYTEADAQRPHSFGIDNWIYPSGKDANWFRALIDGFDKTHPQLLQLQTDLETIRKKFGGTPPNAAVIAFWGDVTADQLAQVSQAASADDESSSGSVSDRSKQNAQARELNETQQSFQQLAMRNQVANDKLLVLVCRQLERVVLSASITSDGLRISGIAIQDRDGKPDETMKMEEE